ncbi:hypothetical protein GAMM_120068 [Gammaproteobacteria bacterium]
MINRKQDSDKATNEEILANAVLGKRKEVLEAEILVFCQKYDNCFSRSGTMATARKEVLAASEALDEAAILGGTALSEALTNLKKKQNKLEKMRGEISDLDDDAVDLVRQIKNKVRDYVEALAESSAPKEEDRKKLLGALGSQRSTKQAQIPKSTPSDLSPQTQELDLLSKDELELLSDFVKPPVSGPEHDKLLETLTTKITIRVCKSVMTGSIDPSALIIDPKACIEGHLKDWQAADDKIGAQQEKFKKISVDKRQLDIKIKEADAILESLTGLKGQTADICRRLEEETKDPCCFYRLVRFIFTFNGMLISAIDDEPKKEELKLEKEALRQIGALVDTATNILEEANLEKENPLDLEHTLKRLGEASKLSEKANECVQKAADEVRKYNDESKVRIEAHQNSVGSRWKLQLFTSIITAATTIATKVADVYTAMLPKL